MTDALAAKEAALQRAQSRGAELAGTVDRLRSERDAAQAQLARATGELTQLVGPRHAVRRRCLTAPCCAQRTDVQVLQSKLGSTAEQAATAQQALLDASEAYKRKVSDARTGVCLPRHSHGWPRSWTTAWAA